jgi:hypothetical protein
MLACSSASCIVHFYQLLNTVRWFFAHVIMCPLCRLRCAGVLLASVTE